MSNLTDPHDGFVSFQIALTNNLINPNPCSIHPEISVLEDFANDVHRTTYALIEKGQAKGYVVFAKVQAYKGLPCFQIGYATGIKYRGKGVATDLLKKSIIELINTYKNSIDELYLEAVISPSNKPSLALTSKIFTDEPLKIKDGLSGEPALQYFLKINTKTFDPSSLG